MVRYACSGQWLRAGSRRPETIGFPSLISMTSLQDLITLSGEFLFAASLTLWPPDLKKNDSIPAPGPALGLVVLTASTKSSSLISALPMLTSRALISAFITIDTPSIDLANVIES